MASKPRGRIGHRRTRHIQQADNAADAGTPESWKLVGECVECGTGGVVPIRVDEWQGHAAKLAGDYPPEVERVGISADFGHSHGLCEFAESPLGLAIEYHAAMDVQNLNRCKKREPWRQRKV